MKDLKGRIQGDIEYLDGLMERPGTVAPGSQQRRLFAAPDELKRIRDTLQDAQDALSVSYTEVIKAYTGDFWEDPYIGIT